VRTPPTLAFYPKVYTASDDGAVGITDGPAIRNGRPEDADDKARRESRFPVKLSLQAFETKLQAAEASVAEDRKRILNTIAGGAPDGAAADADGAHKEHANYEKLNDVLRGRFAAASIRALLDAGKPITDAAALLKRSRMRKLELSFMSCEAFDAQAAHTTFSNLPDCLETLDMRYGGLTPAHAPALAEALEFMAVLTSLNLYRNSIGPEGAKAIAEALGSGKAVLKRLNIDGCELNIEQLKGTDPVKVIDLSQLGSALGSASGIVIAKCI